MFVGERKEREIVPFRNQPVEESVIKKHAISILSAIAPALPPGIGGLIFTAPAAATDADANAIRHRFNTCSRNVIRRCHSRIQKAILFNTGHNRIFPSRAMPEEANGLDQRTFGILNWQSRNRWGPYSGVYAALYPEELISDTDAGEASEDLPAGERFRYVGSDAGYIDPDDRARWNAHLAGRERPFQKAARSAEAEGNRRAAVAEPAGTCLADSLSHCDLPLQSMQREIAAGCLKV